MRTANCCNRLFCSIQVAKNKHLRQKDAYLEFGGGVNIFIEGENYMFLKSVDDLGAKLEMKF